MKKALPVLTIAVLLVIFLVNREFSVADNGDFTRYMTKYVFKPVDVTTNWPPSGSEEWHKRFHSQPADYWNACDTPGSSWFTSAHLFWRISYHLNRTLYSKNVFNITYAGLLFFLLHALAAWYALKTPVQGTASSIFFFFATALFFTNAHLSAFYNSFYADSVPILAIFVLTAFFLRSVFSGQKNDRPPYHVYLFGGLVLFLLVCSIFSKRQYLYFCAPALIFFGYFISLFAKKVAPAIKYALFGCACIVLVFFAVSSVMQRGNSSEPSAVRTTTYHALYYGLLPNSSAPDEIIKALGLPEDSIDLVGKFAWRDDVQNFLETEGNILSLNYFLKAITLDPLAFAKSILYNAQGVGLFIFHLGMVGGEKGGNPPELLTFLSSTSTRVASTPFAVIICLCALLLTIYPIGVAPEKRTAARVFSFILLSIILSDVVISTFDGRQEFAKHVIIASAASLATAVFTALSIFFWITKLIQRVRGVGRAENQ